MKMNLKMRAVSLVATVALLGGTAVVASGQTGAYFSDSVSGAATGTVGSIHIDAASPNIAFSGLLPGTPQSQTVSYTNSGSSPEDVYLTFNNTIALSALNSLGHYGSLTIKSQQAGGLGTVFYSSNLNDNSASCGTFSNATSTVTLSGETAPGMLCWPLPSQVKIASGVPAGTTGSFTFTFEYAGALSTQSGNFTDPWNTYPAVGGQTYTTNSDPSLPTSGAGLPYQIVATQVGITPGQTGYKF